MAKDPAMLWYWSDWHSGTTTFSRFMKGCYMDVLHAQFNSGRLTLEEIKTVLGSDFGQAWPTLQKKFVVDDTGKYFNERLELEKNKRAAFTASRRKNLESIHMKDHTDDHTDSRMENVNDNGNSVVLDFKLKESGKKLELLEARFNEIFDELYLEKNVRPAFRGIDLADQVAKFKVKVVGAITEYRIDDTGRMRNAFLYQLRQIKPDKIKQTKKEVSLDELKKQRNGSA